MNTEIMHLSSWGTNEAWLFNEYFCNQDREFKCANIFTHECDAWVLIHRDGKSQGVASIIDDGKNVRVVEMDVVDNHYPDMVRSLLDYAMKNNQTHIIL